MNLTTISISAAALALFAGAIAVRATQRPESDPGGWRRLPPASPNPAVESELLPIVEPIAPREALAMEQTYERAVRKDERAKQDADEALDEMRHARRKLAESHADDEVSRSHWQRSYQAANLRLESASRVRRRALLSIDGTRTALRALERASPSGR